MVDCGEGTQHQFKISQLRIGKLRNIFITHLHGDHCYGLFGLLHSIRTEKKNFELNIYGPPGIKQMINTTLALSGGLYHYSLNINEITLKQTSFRQRAASFNSNDMDISCNETDDDSMTGDSNNNNTKNKNNKNYKKWKAEDWNSKIWGTKDVTFVTDIENGLKVYACPISHRIQTFGYIFIEPDQLGKLDAAKAKSLGAKGKQLGLLKNGQDITLDDGTIIYSKDVVGDKIIGNKIGVMQDCWDCRSCFEIAQNCDLFIHECTYGEEQKELAKSRGHSTAKMAAENAVKINAKMLMLTHFSSRFVEIIDGVFANNDNNSNSKIKQDNDVEIKGNEDDDEEDLMHVQKLQKEAEEEITKHKNKTCIVRCAADFMSVRFGKNKTITIDKDLAISESKKHHFKHDLEYLKSITQ